MRNAALRNLLESVGWQSARRRRIAGDASPRRYERLMRSGGDTAILMDAPPSVCGSQQPFLAATDYLRRQGFSAPKILAPDLQAGFILLEDLGDALFARVVERNPDAEAEIYLAAINLLTQIRKIQDPGPFQPYTVDDQVQLAALAFEWYRRVASGSTLQPEIMSQFTNVMKQLIAELPPQMVFTHRDFHAENLIWLPEREGVQKVGLLDIQDASLCHPAYDLVSLLEDARRDLSQSLRETCLRAYCDITGNNKDELDFALAVCGSQRNLRIIGTFARLAVLDGKSSYLDLLPRVWQHLQHDLSHPKLVDLSKFVKKELPAVTHLTLTALRAACR